MRKCFLAVVLSASLLLAGCAPAAASSAASVAASAAATPAPTSAPTATPAPTAQATPLAEYPLDSVPDGYTLQSLPFAGQTPAPAYLHQSVCPAVTVWLALPQDWSVAPFTDEQTAQTVPPDDADTWADGQWYLTASESGSLLAGGAAIYDADGAWVGALSYASFAEGYSPTEDYLGNTTAPLPAVTTPFMSPRARGRTLPAASCPAIRRSLRWAACRRPPPRCTNSRTS